MEINQAITIVNSLAGGLREIKEACHLVPIGFFQPTREKLRELEDKILQLEQKINSGFPELKKLIILYSDLKSDVRAAKAKADKLGELIKLSPTVAIHLVLLIGQIQDEYTKINIQNTELPVLDVSEAGELKEKFKRISNNIRDLQSLISRVKSQDLKTHSQEIYNYLLEISREYSGVESKLAELLNKKILNNFDDLQ